MDVDYVKNSLRVLCYYRCILVADIFQFSNCYRLTPRAEKLLTDSAALAEVRTFASLDAKNPPPIAAILRFALDIRASSSIGDMLLSKAAYDLRGIDLRKLLSILQGNGYIARIRRYPISVSHKHSDSSLSGVRLMFSNEDRLYGNVGSSSRDFDESKRNSGENLFVGAQHIDEISLTRKSFTKPTADLLKYSNVIFINK